MNTVNSIISTECSLKIRDQSAEIEIDWGIGSVYAQHHTAKKNCTTRAHEIFRRRCILWKQNMFARFVRCMHVYRHQPNTIQLVACSFLRRHLSPLNMAVYIQQRKCASTVLGSRVKWNIFTRRVGTLPIYSQSVNQSRKLFCHKNFQWRLYNSAAGSWHKLKICSRLLTFECASSPNRCIQVSKLVRFFWVTWTLSARSIRVSSESSESNLVSLRSKFPASSIRLSATIESILAETLFLEGLCSPKIWQ